MAGLTLAGCGGGSGGGALTMPTSPPPSSPPSPPPSPPPVNYDTTEYRANYGLAAINALAAYNDGLSGAGVTVALIDTGVDLDHPDLNNNLHPASRGISTATFSGADDRDAQGHGTAVAGVIAAERNGIGSHGVAFNASLLAINATRPGDCPGDCNFAQSDLAAALDYAVIQGARVINMSLGGSPPGATLTGAMERAVNAGAVIVIAAGNDQAAAPSELAQVAGAPWAQGRILIVGATDQANALAGFSNQAGAYKNVYLVAPGVAIRTTGVGGGQVIASGTSFSTPHAAGALALLAQKFPNLSAAELAEILLLSATDLGAAGVDDVYGYGLINLARAIAPMGVVGLPTGGGIVPASGDTPALSSAGLRLSPAFGDALSQVPALQNAMALDGYGRSYQVDLRRAVTVLAATPSLTGFSRQLQYERRQTLPLSATATLYAAATPATPLEALLDPDDHQGRTMAQVRLERDLPSGARMILALNDAGMDDAGMDLAPDGAVLSRRIDLGAGLEQSLAAAWTWPLGRAWEMGMAAVRGQSGDGPAELSRLWLAGSAGDFRWRFGGGRLLERDSVLGAASSGALRLGRSATTRFAELAAQWSPWEGLHLHLAAQLTRTTASVAAHSLLRLDGGLATLAAEAGLTWQGALRPDDALTLRLALPPRVERGAIMIGQIIGRDYAANTLLYAESRAPLRPSGRQVDLEVGYAAALNDVDLARIHLLYSREPGHYADAAAVAAVAAWTRRF